VLSIQQFYLRLKRTRPFAFYFCGKPLYQNGVAYTDTHFEKLEGKRTEVSKKLLQIESDGMQYEMFLSAFELGILFISIP